ncbi:MAG TPA: flagellar hook-length control protein FliK [Chthonomonadaceae bacterium]|nr:flagellar hook-length control protein FliK [Chthonomonadaceae bacterium]
MSQIPLASGVGDAPQPTVSAPSAPAPLAAAPQMPAVTSPPAQSAPPSAEPLPGEPPTFVRSAPAALVGVAPVARLSMETPTPQPARPPVTADVAVVVPQSANALPTMETGTQAPVPAAASQAKSAAPARSAAVPAPGVVSLPSGAPHAENTPVLVTTPESPTGTEPTSAPAALPTAAQRLDHIDRLLATGDLPVARAAVPAPNAPQVGTLPMASSATASGTPLPAPVTRHAEPNAPAAHSTAPASTQGIPISVRPAAPQGIAAADPAVLAPANAQTTAVDAFGPEPIQPLTPLPFALAAANPPANAKGTGVPAGAEPTENITLLSDRALTSHAGAISLASTHTEGRAATGQGRDTHDEPQPPVEAPAPRPTPNVATVDASHQSAGRITPAPVSAPTARPGLTAERARIVEQVTRHLQAMRLTNGRGEITLRLQPESLGSLHITVASRAEGVLARIVAQTEQAQHVMESARGELRAALESRGLRLHDLDVSVGQGAVSDGRTAFGSSYQTPQERAETAYGRSFARPVVPAETLEAVTPLPALAALSGRHSASRLDYRA